MLSTSDYSSCREYIGESSLRFGEPGSNIRSESSVVNSQANLPPAIPSGLPFACTIVTPIDSDSAATGDPLEATLRSPLRDASGKLLAPVGARLYGRLMAFIEHLASGAGRASYQIGVQFRSIEIDGKRVPFAATLVNAPPSKKVSILPNLHSNVGTLFFYDKKLHLTSLDSNWVTATPTTVSAR